MHIERALNRGKSVFIQSRSSIEYVEREYTISFMTMKCVLINLRHYEENALSLSFICTDSHIHDFIHFFRIQWCKQFNHQSLFASSLFSYVKLRSINIGIEPINILIAWIFQNRFTNPEKIIERNVDNSFSSMFIADHQSENAASYE